MAFTDQDRQEMDVAAANAESDLPDSLEAITVVAQWWNKWYPKAGHKRLAHILLQYAKSPNQES